MDTKIINRYGGDILCYRLRIARQKKRMQYEDFEKKLISLYKEESALYQQRRNLGWEPLIPPIQKGWVRHFVLREDVASSKEATFFENILQKINTYDYSWRKDFKKKKRKRGKKVYVEKPQKILKPYSHQFFKMNFSESEKQFFYEVCEMNSQRQPCKRYVFIEPWRFVLKVRPNIISKIRKRDKVLEMRSKAIDNYLEKNDLRKKQIKLLKGNYKWRYAETEKYNEVDLYKNKSLYQVIDEIKQELDY